MVNEPEAVTSKPFQGTNGVRQSLDQTNIWSETGLHGASYQQQLLEQDGFHQYQAESERHVGR